jgi:hypothetical protein
MYQISNLGNVKSLSRLKIHGKGVIMTNDRILKPSISKKGYHSVELIKNKKGVKIAIHRLVAIAFIPNPENKPEVNHKDLDKSNNHVDNLEWCTHVENMRHANENGRMYTLNPKKGEMHWNSKLTIKQVRDIKLKLKEKTIPQSHLAKEYNIDKSTMHAIKSGKTWKHVTI